MGLGVAFGIIDRGGGCSYTGDGCRGIGRVWFMHCLSFSPPRAFTVVCVLVSASASAGGADLAFPGYSGYLNVPSSTVLDHGQVELQWSDQVFQDGQYEYNRNFIGTVGVFPHVEVGGRIAWEETHSNCFRVDCGIRDLSANVKVQAPLIPERWFTLTGGVQDLGGAANQFGSAYVAAGRAFGPFELTAGFGDPDVPERYLDGAFGAVAWRPAPWLSLMAEHDSRDLRLGAGLSTPSGWLPGGAQLKGKILAYDRGDSDNGRTFASVGLSIPLGRDAASRHLPLPSGEGEADAEPSRLEGPASSAFTEAGDGAAGKGPGGDPEPVSVAERLGRRLVEAGYERVRVGSDGNTLLVHWENNLYNRDERDSIREVAELVRGMEPPFGRARLTLLNQNIPVVYRVVSLRGEAPRVVDSGYPAAGWFSAEPEWAFEGGFGPVWKPRFTFSPAVRSGVATEYGVWDASVALRTELSSSLWTGALASAVYHAEVYSSEDFEKGGVFYDERMRTDLWEAEVQQTLKLHRLFYTSAHAGRYQRQFDGLLNETVLFSPDGRHSLGFLGGAFEFTPVEGSDIRQALGRYSYYNPELDVQLSGHGGQFLEGDTGYRLDGRFWFGDFAVTLTYKNTGAEFIELGWVMPLTPRRDHSFRYLQVRGDPDWTYGIQTRINEDRNTVSFGSARFIRSANPLQHLYMNRGRLPNR